MEEVDDEEDHPRNVAPLNPSRLLELSDGSDNDEEENDIPELMDINDDVENDEDDEEPEESAEAELGQLLLSYIHIILIDKQLDFRKIGTHLCTYSSSKHLQSSISRTVVSMFLNALPHAAWAKGMDGWSVDTLTLVMQNLPATFVNMQKYVGGRMLLLPLTIQRTLELLARP